MSNSVINHQQRLAIIERVACHTVGVAVERNTGVGTGILVANGDEHLVITAEHVIRGVDTKNIRFWCRPPAPIVEKAATDLTRTEMGRLTEGVIFPIEAVSTDSGADLVALKIAPNFELPKPNKFYRLAESHAFTTWPEDQLDGVSLLYFGFPVANSVPIAQAGDNTFRFIGCAHGICHYDGSLNVEGWKKLSLASSFSPEKDFLFEYNSTSKNIAPQGFSGCGVWVGSPKPNSPVWSCDPLLVGMVNAYFRRKNLLTATKVLRIIQIAKFGFQSLGER